MGNEVVAYIESLDGVRKEKIADLFARAQSAVPEATEGVSYGMPALLYRGKALIAFHGARTHIGVYPFSGSIIGELSAALSDYTTSTGTIRLRDDQTLSDRLLGRLIALRKAEIEHGTT